MSKRTARSAKRKRIQEAAEFAEAFKPFETKDSFETYEQAIGSVKGPESAASLEPPVEFVKPPRKRSANRVKVALPNDVPDIDSISVAVTLTPLAYDIGGVQRAIKKLPDTFSGSDRIRSVKEMSLRQTIVREACAKDGMPHSIINPLQNSAMVSVVGYTSGSVTFVIDDAIGIILLLKQQYVVWPHNFTITDERETTILRDLSQSDLAMVMAFANVLNVHVTTTLDAERAPVIAEVTPLPDHFWSEEEAALVEKMREFSVKLIWAAYQRVRIPLNEERPHLLPVFGDEPSHNTSVKARPQSVASLSGLFNEPFVAAAAASPSSRPVAKPFAKKPKAVFKGIPVPKSLPVALPTFIVPHVILERQAVAKELASALRDAGFQPDVVDSLAQMWQMTLQKDLPQVAETLNLSDDPLQIAIANACSVVERCSAFTLECVDILRQTWIPPVIETAALDLLNFATV